MVLLQQSINLGDIVFTKSAVKLDGVSKQYLDVAYPAVASYSLTQSFVTAAKEYSVPLSCRHNSCHLIHFWPGQESE